MYTFRSVLAEYLIKTNHLQALGESIRLSIAGNPFFQYQTAFQRVDAFRKGYLIPADFSQFLLENQTYPTEDQLYVLFRDFDSDRNGTVTLNKFADEILPQQNEKAKRQAAQKKYYRSNQRLQIDLEFLILRFIQHKVKAHNELQEIRVKLGQMHPEYHREAFHLIDRKQKSFLTAQDIDLFLRSSGKLLKSDQIQRIFRVLTQSKTIQEAANQNLQYSKFLQHLHPFCQGYYMGYASRIAEKKQMQKKVIQKRLIQQQRSTKNSRRQAQLQIQIQSLRDSRRQLQSLVYQKQYQLSMSHLLEGQLRKNYYY